MASIECDDLTKKLADFERNELMRAHGRIEPRNRFPNIGSHPLLKGLGVCALSIDECGRPQPSSTSSQSVFALGAIAFDAEDIPSYQDAADDIKLRHFGKTDLTFHDPYIRNREGPFYFSGDLERQKSFDADLLRLIDQAKFVAFGVAEPVNRNETLEQRI